jgi:hypothetical protein
VLIAMWNHADNSDVKRISGEPTGGVTLRKNSSVPDPTTPLGGGFLLEEGGQLLPC